jgi:hypothetical protein
MTREAAFGRLAGALVARDVQFVVIGVQGINHYARRAGSVLATRDTDLFLPRDANNLLRAWQACKLCGLELWSGREPLDSPRDLWLAQRIVANRALTRARDDQGLEIDLSFVMGDFEFEKAWKARRTFAVEGVDVPVAKLSHIIASKAAANRDKDRLFLATYKELLEELTERDDRAP